MKPDEQHALLQRYREAVNTPKEKRTIYRLSGSGECPRQRNPESTPPRHHRRINPTRSNGAGLKSGAR